MNANDWLALGGYALWIITIVVGAYISNGFLKNKRLDSKTQILMMLVKNAVSFYENSELSDETKKNRVINDVVNSLRSKGFNVSGQTVKDINRAVENAVKGLKKTVDKSETVKVEGFKPKGDDKNGK